MSKLCSDKTDIGALRTARYIRQIKGSVVFKGGAVVASFLTMPIMIEYLGVELFGIWATMLTLITWVMLFDLGIGNGLKNKVAECIANDDRQSTVGYISTAYVVIGGVSLVLLILFLSVGSMLPWQTIFNTEYGSDELSLAMLSLIAIVVINFWLSLVNNVLHGVQKSSVVVFGQFVTHFVALVASYVLLEFFESSLVFLVWAYGAALIISSLLLHGIMYSSEPKLFPRMVKYERKFSYSLVSLGGKFFIIQVAALILFLTDKIIITQLMGPSFVTSYEVVFKLFSIYTILHGLILLPLWPAYSDAYTRGDFQWIETQMKKQIKIVLVIFFGAFVTALVGESIVYYWIGGLVEVDQSLFYMFALFIVLSAWSNVYAYFVNATGLLNIQLITAIIAAIINIPLSILFVNYFQLGLDGVVLATIISLSLFSILGPIQVYKVIQNEK